MANTAPTPGASALTFTFSAQALRCILRDGEPWFVAADVCDSLGLDDTSKACSRLDDDEKGTNTVRTLKGNQELLVINESGLYSLILTSRKPEAKKFKKWVTSEVLPAIRRTGRYVAPAAQPEPAHRAAEQISAGDQQAIQRCIWFITRSMRYESTWVQAIWFYLRTCLQMPTPARFTTDQLPRISHELARAMVITRQVHDIVEHVEREAAKRIFRKGEDADKVLACLKAHAASEAAKLTEQKPVPTWLQNDLRDVTQGGNRMVQGVNYQGPEKLGFFDQVKP
jgi:prophage antirepressor-like protein